MCNCVVKFDIGAKYDEKKPRETDDNNYHQTIL